jgi:hypothetical protein
MEVEEYDRLGKFNIRMITEPEGERIKREEQVLACAGQNPRFVICLAFHQCCVAECCTCAICCCSCDG